MSEIESLRQRVEAAAARFSEMDSLRQSQGERLLALIGEFEQGLERKQEEIDRQQARFAEFEAEKARLEAQLEARQAEIERRAAEGARQAAEIDGLQAENGQLNDLLSGLLATLGLLWGWLLNYVRSSLTNLFERRLREELEEYVSGKELSLRLKNLELSINRHGPDKNP